MTAPNYEEHEWRGQKLRFYPKSHTYKVQMVDLSWVKVPSVTTVLNGLDFGKSGALAYWAANMGANTLAQQLEPYDGKVIPSAIIPGLAENIRKAHTKKKDKASDKGNVAHAYLDKYCVWLRDGGTKPHLPKDEGARAIIKRGTDWLTKHDVKPLHVEARMCGMIGNEWYAGTVDLVAYIDGDLWIIDWKTSNHPSFTHVLQMVGYDEFCGREAIGYRVVYLDLKSTARAPSTPFWDRVTRMSFTSYVTWTKVCEMYAAVKAFEKEVKP